MRTHYAIELAREIIESKEVKATKYIPIRTNESELVKFEDNYIEVIAGKNTKVLHVTIKNPLTSASSNPIIYVNDEGECYRSHGEHGRFIMYAERLLNKELTVGLYEDNIEKQKTIDSLFVSGE